MNLAGVLQLLQQRTGLDPDALGIQAVRLAVQERLRHTGETDLQRYVGRLTGDAGEFAELVNAVMVSETWFYRGGVLFDHLATYLAGMPLPASGEPLRVLSLPCSTGEEPYSLVIALRERGVAKERCTIEGVDINARNIERARQGVYGALSFRQLPTALQQRYFQPVGAGLQIEAGLRAMVQFRVGNIFDSLATFRPPYQVVLCRNLFIYLDRPARKRAVEQLDRLLAADGLLCLGHADRIEPADGAFERVEPLELFLYRKSRISLLPQRPPLIPAVERPVQTQPAEPVVELPGIPKVLPRPGIPDSVDESESTARSLADSGRYKEALTCCETLLRKNGPSAEVYALLGTIHLARQDLTAAAACLQRALYLDPQHREALWQQWILHRLRGEIDRAERIRERLERLGEQGDRQ